ncbi:MAG: CDP-diacylglycerol--serine O-phosphatidyltransferase [Euryarchaeota archaeon]|nr:CDP-diacylglycerol--serine O-phosphatidyltransferase [Euryarchaeota archaeon]
MRELIRSPDLFSITNALFGSLAIFAALVRDLSLSARLIILAAFADGMDGLVARKKGASEFGKNLDSLADTISFGVCPAILVFQTNTIFPEVVSGLSASLIVICGILRLARFNILSEEISMKMFVGLPIPAAAMFIISLFLALPAEWTGKIIALVALTLALLMVSSIKYPKYTGKKLRPLLIMIGLIAIVVVTKPNIFMGIFTKLFLVGAFCYVVFSPIIFRGGKNDNES